MEAAHENNHPINTHLFNLATIIIIINQGKMPLLAFLNLSPVGGMANNVVFVDQTCYDILY